ncbi:MAG: DUF4255 domain-containing protein [Bacteroidetes bacterium]|nr:MAG: DUF4255 domain-containing protein [Bacteroidota bacterium]
MIDFTVSFIANQLTEYLEKYSNNVDVEGGNIAEIDGGIGEKVIITLVNIEEEHTLTNQKYTKKINNQLIKKEPPITLNLYFLISFGVKNYQNKLFQMTKTLEFFQINKLFTPNSHPDLKAQGIEKLVFKLFTMDMEQLNDLWGMLGGKFYPSLFYKVRLVEIEAKQSDGLGIPIEEIEVDAKLKE